jgi:predicted RNA-binding protein YlqC (UPF0109 family)
MRDLVESIVKNLVDHEGKVEVNLLDGSDSSIIQVKVEVGDVGKIIGKNGNTARSIRTLLKAVGKKNNRRYTLNIISDEKVQ